MASWSVGFSVLILTYLLGGVKGTDEGFGCNSWGWNPPNGVSFGSLIAGANASVPPPDVLTCVVVAALVPI